MVKKRWGMRVKRGMGVGPFWGVVLGSNLKQKYHGTEYCIFPDMLLILYRM